MSRRDSNPARTLSGGIRHVPFTLGFLGVMLVANAVAGTFSGQIDPAVLSARGIGVQALSNGDLTRFVTAIFLSHDLAMLLRQLFFAAIVIGMTEWRWGSWRAAGLFFGLDFAATGLLLVMIAGIPGLGAVSGVTDVGMSMGGFGLIGVLAATWRRGWFGLVVILGAVALKYAFAPEPFADLGHVVALVIGFLVGIYRQHIRRLADASAGFQRQGGRR